MQRRQRTGIFRKTFLLSFLMMVVIILLFAALTIPRQRNAILKSIEAQANGISSSIAQVCANAIAIEDYAFIVEHNLQVLQGSPHILYIIVEHRNGFSLLHTRSQWEQRDTPDPRWRVGTEETAAGRILYSDLVQQNVFHYSFPLKYSVVSWGYLYLGVSLKDFHREITTMYAIMSLLSLLCLISGVIGAYVFARKLTRPILALRQATNQLARGDLSIRARISTRDELADLAVSFNQMAENLEKTTVSKDFVGNILETMTESLVVTTATGTIRMVNQATLKLLGYTEHELLEQPLNILFPEGDMFLKETWIDDLMLRGGEQNSERIVRAKTGDPIPVLFSAAVMYSDDQMQGIVCVSLDIRQRIQNRELLENLRLHRDQLETQLAQSQKMEAVGQLAGGIAHDFNTLLGIILGYGDMMRDDIPEGTLLWDNLEGIIKASYRAKTLIRQLLDFARPSEKDRHPIQLTSLVEDSLRMLRSSLPTTITIRQRIEAESSIVRANSTQIVQVIMNLGMNAGDVIAEQRGEIDISLTEVEVDGELAGLQAVKPGTYVKLNIRDTGCGMRPETLERIFEPFFTTKEVGKGSGLGLAVVHGIVKSHGGFIMVESEFGKGSKFQVYLPTIKN